jgi:hypothetical protein
MNAVTNALRICTVIAILLSTASIGAFGQKNLASSETFLSAKIPHFKLENETLQQGFQKLASGQVPYAYGFENVLKPKFNDPRIPDPLFSLQMDDRTIQEILDALCGGDPRYMWSIDEGTINVYPRATVGDPLYLPNRSLKVLRFEGITQIVQGLFAIAQQLPPPEEQVAHVQTGGGAGEYPPGPWTAVFYNVTVRQALNRLSAHIGPHGSWILYGSKEFREFAFYEGVMPHQPPAAFASRASAAGAPVVSNLGLRTASFTTHVANGEAVFTTDVTVDQLSGVALPILFTVRRSAASNPSKVILDDLSDHKAMQQCTISGNAGTCSVSFPVSSSSSNTQSGSVSWQFLYSSNSPYAVFNVSPNPLKGTVAFVK